MVWKSLKNLMLLKVNIMRIMTWNCEGAFRNKYHEVLDYHPDILIIPECEKSIMTSFEEQDVSISDFTWIGENKHKGVGVFSFTEAQFGLHSSYCPDYEYVLPLEVQYKGVSFDLLPVWTKNSKNKARRYIGQLYYALQHYSSILNERSIIIGDFNWNKVFDREKKNANWGDTLEILAQHKIESLYHLDTGERFGEETVDTFFMHRKLEKGYHIDYCFAGPYWQKKLSKVDILTQDKWIKCSDHRPLSVEFFG